MENSTMSQEELLKIQENAIAELEKIINSCDDINALVEQISDWQDKYNIINIDDFFIDDNLRIHARNLLSNKFESLKKEKEEALKVLNMASQKKTFLKLYTICSNAKNDKDFEVAQKKLKEWLKAHPKNTWENFNENYQKFFEKFASEDYLRFITGYSEQEKIISTLEEIVDYSVRYSDFAFFQENLQIWESEYSNRDNFLNSQNKDKIANLLKDTTEKLTPPDFQTKDFNDFDNLSGAIAYNSLALTIASSSNKLSSTVDWISMNMPLLTSMTQKDGEKIVEVLMEKFKINIIPESFDFTVEDVREDSNIVNVRNNVLNFLLYKLNSHTLTSNDKEIFDAASVKSLLLSTEDAEFQPAIPVVSEFESEPTVVEPVIPEHNSSKTTDINPVNEEPSQDKRIAAIDDKPVLPHEETNQANNSTSNTTAKESVHTVENKTVPNKKVSNAFSISKIVAYFKRPQRHNSTVIATESKIPQKNKTEQKPNNKIPPENKKVRND